MNDAANDDPKNNAIMKLKVINNYPRLCLFARREIAKGEEIRYDYGDSVYNLPWRHKVNIKKYGFSNFTCCVIFCSRAFFFPVLLD